MLSLLSLAMSGLLLPCSAPAQDAQIVNGGFEEVGEGGAPASWKAFGAEGWSLVPEAAHAGKAGLRLGPTDKQQWLRQQHGAVATRSYVVSGWFRANGVGIDPAKPDEHARLYVHVLYEGRKYDEGLQVWADIPGGTWDWRRFAVSVVPNPAWAISELWVTVTSQIHEGELLCDDVAVGPGGFRGGASVLGWANGAKPRVLTDMSACKPKANLSASRQRGKWKVMDYEIGPYKGKLLTANPDAAAEAVTLPVDATGWHAVYLGIMEGKVRVKLTGDPAYVGRSRNHGSVEEVFIKAADLTGQGLMFAQQGKGTGIAASVAYVKLIPLTPEEVARIQAERADTAARRISTSIDGFSYIYEKGCTTEEEVLEEVEEFRDSDVGLLYVGVGGAEMVNYATKVGNHCGLRDGELLETYPDRGDRTYAEALKEMLATGVNPTALHIRRGKELGMKVHVSIRTAAWEYGEPPYDEFFVSPFYQAHPEWRCVDRDGTPVARMSFAVPEVRKHLVDVLREAVQFGADGANIIYVRGAPYVLWEEPFCKLFQERYGEDAGKVAEDDKRIQELRVEVMTQFMREVRAMLDEEQARRGDDKRLETSAFVLADEADNLRFGVDVRGWCAGGLLDDVSPYLHSGGGTAKAYDLGFFKEACGDKGIPWRPTIVAWDAPGVVDMMRLALRYYDAGATGITFWDGNALTGDTAKWSVASRMGRVEELRERVDLGAPSTLYLSPHRIGEHVNDARYRTYWGY